MTAAVPMGDAVPGAHGLTQHAGRGMWHLGADLGTASPGVGLQAELILMGRWYLQQMENGISITVSVKDLFSQWIPSHYGRTQPRKSRRQTHTRVCTHPLPLHTCTHTRVLTVCTRTHRRCSSPLSPLNSYGAQARVWGAFLPHLCLQEVDEFPVSVFWGLGDCCPKRSPNHSKRDYSLMRVGS